MANKMITAGEACDIDIDTVRAWYKEYVNPGIEDVIYTFSFGEDLVDRAEGVWMYFRKKGKVFDATGGMGVLTIGHNHQRILATRIKFQQMQRMEVHKVLFSQYTAALSHNMALLFDKKLQYSFFCNSGAEAVEGAVKTAYKYHDGKRKSILHSDVSYHGKLLGAGSITGSKDVNFKFPAIPDTHSFKYNSIDSVKFLIKELRKKDNTSDIYAIIIEPYSVSTFTPGLDSFLAALRAICDENDIMLIFDEIYSGWYKTGPLFYFMKSGIYPDILTVSKSLGGGKSSISAVISKGAVFKRAFGNVQNAYLHSTTYNGFGEECITAIEAINIMIEEDISGKTKIIENKVIEWLDRIKAKFPAKITSWSGSGSFFGFKINIVPEAWGRLIEILPSGYAVERLFLEKLEAAAFCEYLFCEYNIYALFGGQHEIYVSFSPSAIVAPDELDQVLEKIDAAIGAFSFVHIFNFALKKFKKKAFN